MTIYNDNQTIIQPVELGYVIDPERPVLPYWKHVTDAMCSESHAHPRGQFIFSSKGVTRVITKKGIYLVPSSQAFWCPPNLEHMLVFPGAVEIANLFIDPHLINILPREQQVLTVSPLLKELIMKAVKIGTDYLPKTREHRVMEVIIDEISVMEVSPLALPWSENRRLNNIMSSLLDEPTNKNTIEEWALSENTTTRTLSRLFKREVNMTFTEWRMHVRIFYAVEQLHQNISVTDIALQLGYSTPSSFITAFRKVLGKSPLEFIYNLDT